MSEYQYSEFQEIDRSLTKAEQAEIAKLSSRVIPTAHRACFTYSHGDFPKDPKTILTQYFDAMFYIANLGTRQLIFRFPKASIDLESIESYCVEDAISISETSKYLILDNRPFPSDNS